MRDPVEFYGLMRGITIVFGLFSATMHLVDAELIWINIFRGVSARV
jgi:hypothetical protein